MATPRASCRHALGPLADDWPAPDLGSLKKSFPNWFPFVDVQFGSGALCPCSTGPATGLGSPGARCSPAGRTGHGGRAQAPGLVRLSLPRSPRRSNMYCMAISGRSTPAWCAGSCPDGGRAAVVPAGTAVRRYGDAAREAAATRSVTRGLAGARPGLAEEASRTGFRSSMCSSAAAPAPLFDGARYQVFLDPRARCSPARTDRPRRKGSSAWAGEAELAPVGRADVLAFASKNKWGRVNGNETLTRRNGRISTPTEGTVVLSLSFPETSAKQPVPRWLAGAGVSGAGRSTRTFRP